MERAITTPAVRVAAFWMSFCLLALAGCSSSTSPQPAPGSAGPKGSQQEALKSLQDKLPPPAPSEPGVAPDEKALLSKADETVKAWVKDLDADNDRAVRAICLSEADLQKVAGEGLQNILSSSLLPENVRVAEALLTAADGKDVAIRAWSPGKIYLTQKGAPYKESVPMLKSGKLQLSLGGTPTEYDLDLMAIDGRWKIFKIEKKS